MTSGDRGLVYLMACAASPARHICGLAQVVMRQGWRVQVIATAECMSWLDCAQLQASTGHRPLSMVADIGPDGLEVPDVVLVAPATFNTVNKVAGGLSDSLALDVIHDAIGDGIALVLVPHVRESRARHPLYQSHLAVLRALGAAVFPEVCEGGCAPHQHWTAAVRALAGLGRRPSGMMIRPETRGDVAETARSHVAAWNAGYRGLVPDEVLDTVDVEQRIVKRRRALAEPDGSLTLVAVRGRQVLGHVTVRGYPDEPQVGQVWACYVDPQAWGSGVADQLIRRGLLLLPDDVVRLWVLEANARAVAFYRRHGFHADGERSNYQFTGTNISMPLIRMTLDRTVHPGR